LIFWFSDLLISWYSYLLIFWSCGFLSYWHWHRSLFFDNQIHIHWIFRKKTISLIKPNIFNNMRMLNIDDLTSAMKWFWWRNKW
jgi:hypothetical protein